MSANAGARRRADPLGDDRGCSGHGAPSTRSIRQPPHRQTLTLGCAVFWELCDEHINNDRLLQRRLGGSRSWPGSIGLTARCAVGSGRIGCTRPTTRARPRSRAGWLSWPPSNVSSTRTGRCRRPSGRGERPTPDRRISRSSPTCRRRHDGSARLAGEPSAERHGPRPPRPGGTRRLRLDYSPVATAAAPVSARSPISRLLATGSPFSLRRRDRGRGFTWQGIHLSRAHLNWEDGVEDGPIKASRGARSPARPPTPPGGPYPAVRSTT